MSFASGIVPFVARTAAEALARVQADMGPEAIVLNVRQLPMSGISRLWRKPHVEVLACPPELFSNPADEGAAPVASTRHDLSRVGEASFVGAEVAGEVLPGLAAGKEGSTMGRWGVESLLGQAGLVPLVVNRLMEDLESQYGSRPSASLGQEVARVRETLRQLWTVADPVDSRRPQVLVGARGVGKTTVLCKWLTQLILVEGGKAQVFRVDGQTANTAELLQVHGEILNVPVLHELPRPENFASAQWQFVDVPGVDWRDQRAVGELRRLLEKISGAEVHLVVNGAYDIPVLLSQVRAFSGFPLSGLIVTHLDEDSRWSKLWNLVLGTPLALRFLSAEQNIPGEFFKATSDRLSEGWLGRRSAAN